MKEPRHKARVGVQGGEKAGCQGGNEGFLVLGPRSALLSQDGVQKLVQDGILLAEQVGVLAHTDQPSGLVAVAIRALDAGTPDAPGTAQDAHSQRSRRHVLVSQSRRTTRPGRALPLAYTHRCSCRQAPTRSPLLSRRRDVDLAYLVCPTLNTKLT